MLARERIPKLETSLGWRATTTFQQMNGKVSGKGYVIKDGKPVLAELHWYEADGEIYELKVKRYLDES